MSDLVATIDKKLSFYDNCINSDKAVAGLRYKLKG